MNSSSYSTRGRGDRRPCLTLVCDVDGDEASPRQPLASQIRSRRPREDSSERLAAAGECDDQWLAADGAMVGVFRPIFVRAKSTRGA